MRGRLPTIARAAAAFVTAMLAGCSSPPEDNSATNAAAANASVPADVTGDIARYLPAAGSHAARAMRLFVPAEYERLSARMAAAIQRDPAWFQNYARQHPGARGPLPWHPRFGLSEAEYRRMVAMIGDARLDEIGRLAVTVTAAPDGGFALAAAGPAARLNGIVLHPGRDYVETPRGRLTRRIAINQDDPHSPTGRWTGVQWSSTAPGPGIRLAIGIRQSGEGVLYYDVAGADDTVLLLYDRRPSAGAR